MSGARCKAAIDCNGEVMEAITNVPLLVVNDLLEDDAIDAFNLMKAEWAKDYRHWKAKYIDFEDD